MRTLPIALPQCGAPATTRIEIYSAGSLDASAYTCDSHTTTALAAVAEEAGLEAHPVPLAPDINRPCGHVHVYPTGQLADPDDAGHPPWCDRKDCNGRGQHRSIRLTVSTGKPEAVIADVALTQALGQGVEPMLSFTVVDGDAGQEMVLSLGQGRVLSYQVRRLLDLSKGYTGNRRPSW